MARLKTSDDTAAAAAASSVVAAAPLLTGNLVEACPYIGPYASPRSDGLQDYEFTLPPSPHAASASSSPNPMSILPVGLCSLVRLVADGQPSVANVALELETATRHVLMVATRAIEPGDELRAVAIAAPDCARRRRPQQQPFVLAPTAVVDGGGSSESRGAPSSSWCAAPKLEVRPSPLHGRGVFATTDLAVRA